MFAVTCSQLLSGVEAGVVMVLLFNPVWVVKTRLALQGVALNQKHTYSGPIGEQKCALLRDRSS